VVISSTASVSNLAFSSGLGGNLLPLYSNVPSAGVASGLTTADGEAVTLFRAASDDNIALGYDSSGQLVLALYLEQNAATNPTGAKIWMVAYEAMAHLPSMSGDEGATVANLFVSAFTATNFDLGTLASGQNRWNVFGDSANQVIVIADEAWSKGQTINTSQGGGSTTIANTNQLMEGRDPGKDVDGEALVFTFAQNSVGLFTADKGTFSALAPAALLGANEVTWSISQVQGSGNFAVATIKALLTTPGQNGDEFAKDVDPSIAPNDDLIKAITSVTIRSADGTFSLTAADGVDKSLARTVGKGGSRVTFNVSIDFKPDGTVEISGLREKDRINYSTPEDHNRVEIRNTGNVGATLDWDIGAFSIQDAGTFSVPVTVQLEDDAPGVGSNAAVQLDDDALSGGNAAGSGDDADGVNVSGALAHSIGADGYGSVAYLTSGAPSGFTYELSGSNLLIKQGTTTVLTLTVNSSTGAYSVSQNVPISHAAGSDENNQVFSVNYRVTDRDGDSADGTLAINVDDDTPTLQSALSGDPDPATITYQSAMGPSGAITGEHIAWNPGADGYGSLSVSSLTGTPPDAAGVYGYTIVNPSSPTSPTTSITIDITYDADGAGSARAQTIARHVFNAAGEDSFQTYDYAGLINITPTQLESGSAVKPGGPHPVEFQLFSAPVLDLAILVTGATRAGASVTTTGIRLRR
jgi:hypothetical protein